MISNGRVTKTVMAASTATSNLNTLNEKEPEQISTNVSGSAHIGSESSNSNLTCDINSSDSSPFRVVDSEEKPRTSETSKYVSGGKFLTRKAQDPQLSPEEVKTNEGGKISSDLNTNELKSSVLESSDDQKGRAQRKVRKGYEVYQVKRGKYSEKISISENDYRLPEAGKVRGDLGKKPIVSKGKKMQPKGDKNPPFTVDKTTQGSSSPFLKTTEDWDFEEPNVGTSEISENKLEDHVTNSEVTHSQERHEISVNNELNNKPHQQNKKAKESSKFVSNSLGEKSKSNEKGTKKNVNNKSDIHSCGAAEEHGQSKEELKRVENSYSKPKSEDSVIKGGQLKNRKLDKPMEGRTGSGKRGVGRGKKSQEPPLFIGQQSKSSKVKEVNSESKSSTLAKSSSKEDSTKEHPMVKTENSQALPQKSNHEKDSSDKSRLLDNNLANAEKRVQFSNRQNDNLLNENITDSDAQRNASRTAGILVLPSPIGEQYDAAREDCEPKKNREDTETNHGFSKLDRPSGFDHNKPRGDAKLVKDNKVSLLERKEDIRISTSDSEIWSRIKSECKNLQKLLLDDLTCLEDIEKILELSIFLQDLYKELIVKHLEFSFKNDVEGSLWKNTFHNIITAFRNILNEPESCSFMQEAFQFYWNFLQDGDDFLQDLLTLLQEECKFNLEAFVHNPLKMLDCKKQQKFGIRSCHLILLNLGDLERYIADLQQNTPYTKANENYLKAQMLAPKNGKSYNQLAIVAVKSKKKLDAIFYYIRSLEASNPIESSRERLTGIFHEIKRKADFTKMQSLKKSYSFAEAAKKANSVTEDEEDFRSDYSREDIWAFYRGGKYFKAKIAQNGKILELTDTHAKEPEHQASTEKVSLTEVNKEFLIYYLYMHSKLYSRIGFEHVMTVYEDAIQPFKVLLKHNKASCIKKAYLVKYMAINIFAVNNLFRKQDCSLSVVKDSPLDVAIIFGMDMSAKMAEHCCCLIENNELNVAEQFLPAIHVWMKWMAGYLDLINASSVCYMKDIWESYIKFLSTIKTLEAEKVKEIDDGEPTGLYEDIFLSGFKPLMDMENPSMKVAEEQKQKAEAFMRAESLKDLAYMFSESHKLPIVFNEETSSFQVAMPDDTISSPAKDKILPLLDDSANNENDSDSDVIIEDAVEDIDDRDLQHLNALKAKKMELTAQFIDNEKRKQERDAIVETNASQTHIISENHPKYIVPDTNCFIDYLDGLVRIMDSKDFTIILPLIVVNELDGLKKGRELKMQSSNTAIVKERARLAVEMLERRFGDSDKQLKALTSAGTELETIAFRDEELSADKGKNDDIILSCCLHYCEETTNRFASGGGPLRVQRNVVLLTDDRNLRLKAHSRHVPTLSMKMFLRMAHLT